MQMKKTLLFLGFIVCSLAVCSQQGEMKTMSFNIRNDNSGDANRGDGWKERRCEATVNMILFYDIDILGMQECKHHQVEDLKKGLAVYDYVGVGRDDGKTLGEYAPIFYKVDRFELLDKGDFWLSETPEEVGKKGWDAALPRICSWGKFRDKNTGFTFYYYNLHVDHIGVNARLHSAELVLNRITEMRAAEDCAAILTGDFNVNQTSEGYKLLSGSGVLFDSYQLSPVLYHTNGTMSGFDVNRRTYGRIDHVFITKEFSALRHGILTDNYWSVPEGVEAEPMKSVEAEPRMPSDHYPVMVVLRY